MPKVKDGAIRRLRERKSWSQEDLACKAGVSPRTVQRAESGSSLNPTNLACIAEALEVAPEDLLDQETSRGVVTSESSPKAVQAGGAIPVVLRQMSDGNELIGLVSGSLALAAEARAVTASEDAEAIGVVLDELRDYLDIGNEMSFADQLQYAVGMTSRIDDLKRRGWWILAGRKRHGLRSLDSGGSIPWITGVVIVARADDSIVQHREDGEPVAFAHLPSRVSFR